MNMSHFWSTCFLKTSLNSDLSNCSQQKEKKTFLQAGEFFSLTKESPQKLGRCKRRSLSYAAWENGKPCNMKMKLYSERPDLEELKNGAFFPPSSSSPLSSLLLLLPKCVCVCSRERQTGQLMLYFFVSGFRWKTKFMQVENGAFWLLKSSPTFYFRWCLLLSQQKRQLYNFQTEVKKVSRKIEFPFIHTKRLGAAFVTHFLLPRPKFLCCLHRKIPY